MTSSRISRLRLSRRERCVETLDARWLLSQSGRRLADDERVLERALRAWLFASTVKRTGPSCISVIGWCPSRRCGVAVSPTT